MDLPGERAVDTIGLKSPPMAMPERNASRCIMVVDDDLDVRLACSELLRAYGYEVVTCCDAFEALARLRRGALPAAMVLDLQMPRMSGQQLLKELAYLGLGPARLPAVVVSGSPRDVGGAAKVLAKPIRENELLDALAALTQRAA